MFDDADGQWEQNSGGIASKIFLFCFNFGSDGSWFIKGPGWQGAERTEPSYHVTLDKIFDKPFITVDPEAVAGYLLQLRAFRMICSYKAMILWMNSTELHLEELVNKGECEHSLLGMRFYFCDLLCLKEQRYSIQRMALVSKQREIVYMKY